MVEGRLFKQAVLGGLAVLAMGMMFMLVRKAGKPAVLPTAEELVGVPPALNPGSDVVGEADAQRHFPAMLLAHALIAVGLTAIYRRGREAGKSAVGQGLRFGLWFAVAACVPGFLIYYAVQPVGHMVAVKQIIFGGIATVLLGLVVAAMNRQTA